MAYRSGHGASEELAAAQRLRSLTIYNNTGITQAQIDALQAALPACEISYRESRAIVYRTWLDALPDTVYYNGQGGRFYHINESCPSVATKYLPMRSLEKAQLSDSPFYHLSQCPKCVMQLE